MSIAAGPEELRRDAVRRRGGGRDGQGVSRHASGKAMLVERPAQSPISVVIWPIFRIA